MATGEVLPLVSPAWGQARVATHVAELDAPLGETRDGAPGETQRVPPEPVLIRRGEQDATHAEERRELQVKVAIPSLSTAVRYGAPVVIQRVSPEPVSIRREQDATRAEELRELQMKVAILFWVATIPSSVVIRCGSPEPNGIPFAAANRSEERYPIAIQCAAVPWCAVQVAKA